MTLFPAPTPCSERALSFSEPFVRRPVATTLLTLGVALAGVIGFFLLPVAPLPQVELPDDLGVGHRCRARARTPWRRAWRRRWSGRWAASPASTRSPRSSLAGQHAHHAAVRPGPQHRRRGARRAGGHQRGARAAAHGLPNNPTYRKVNPADAPIMILALTSDDAVARPDVRRRPPPCWRRSSAQVEGIGQVTIGGGALPAVRVEARPDRLAANGISLEDVRAALTATNANRPKGAVEDADAPLADRRQRPGPHGRRLRAADHPYRNGNAVRLKDVAQVIDSVQDVRNYGVADGKPSILLMLFKQPGANMIESVGPGACPAAAAACRDPGGHRPAAW